MSEQQIQTLIRQHLFANAVMGEFDQQSIEHCAKAIHSLLKKDDEKLKELREWVQERYVLSSRHEQIAAYKNVMDKLNSLFGEGE